MENKKRGRPTCICDYCKLDCKDYGVVLCPDFDEDIIVKRKIEKEKQKEER